jgi:hypothetical protein
VADKARLWSETRLADLGTVGIPTYRLGARWQTHVALMPSESPDQQKAQNHLILLENLFDELRRRAPMGGK